jgi:uncharacterized protein YcbK (DUF882 family)
MATRQRLSTHFTVEEFDCRDGTKVQRREYESLKVLCRLYLEPLRKRYGRVKINSGYRTRTYNRKIGGASRSFHVYPEHDGNDQAADITCQKGTPRQWHRTLSILRRTKRGGRGGLGLYKNFVHVDLRDYKADWRG